MQTMHAYPPDIKEARNNPKIIADLQMRKAKEWRDKNQFLENTNLAIVFHEGTLNGEQYDESNDVESAGSRCFKCFHIYNACRFFLIDRKTLEKEIWSQNE